MITHRVEIVAHRGASHEAPENTLAAVRLAWEQAADAVEIDVHLSRDGELVVMHDASTRRTTGVDAEISQCTLQELKKLDVGAWKGEQFAGEAIPTLDEVLRHLPPQKRILIEIKGGGAGTLALLYASLERTGVDLGQVHVICFDSTILSQAKCEYPDLKTLWLRGVLPAADEATRTVKLEETIRVCRAANLDGLSLDHRWPIDRQVIQQIKSAGLTLYAWTVNDPDTAQALADAGIDGITTDRLAEIQAALWIPLLSTH